MGCEGSKMTMGDAKRPCDRSGAKQQVLVDARRKSFNTSVTDTGSFGRDHTSRSHSEPPSHDDEHLDDASSEEPTIASSRHSAEEHADAECLTAPVEPMLAVFKTVRTTSDRASAHSVGAMCLLHFPGKKQLRILSESSCDYIVTLQKDEEGAQDVKAMCQRRGFSWMQVDFWPMYHKQRVEELMGHVRAVSNLIRSGKRVMVHCAAGIHRTGMFAYAVLRNLGYTPKAAVQSLKALRETTYNRVGAHRIQGVESLLSASFPYPLSAPFEIPASDLPPVVEPLPPLSPPTSAEAGSPSVSAGSRSSPL
ncbi:hypothetical protein DIPPA_34648 [Diplonema papillatum]|nr:hypothetical protein DIPPA_34648 [Diplonema papillatum]